MTQKFVKDINTNILLSPYQGATDKFDIDCCLSPLNVCCCYGKVSTSNLNAGIRYGTSGAVPVLVQSTGLSGFTRCYLSSWMGSNSVTFVDLDGTDTYDATLNQPSAGYDLVCVSSLWDGSANKLHVEVGSSVSPRNDAPSTQALYFQNFADDADGKGLKLEVKNYTGSPTLYSGVIAYGSGVWVDMTSIPLAARAYVYSWNSVASDHTNQIANELVYPDSKEINYLFAYPEVHPDYFPVTSTSIGVRETIMRWDGDGRY